MTETEDTHETQKAPEKKPGWFARLKQGLRKSSGSLTNGISDFFTKRKLDDDAIEDLEDLLIRADLGVATATKITGNIAESRFDKEVSPEEIQTALSEEITKILAPVARPFEPARADGPHVCLVVGVNGSGKTTTIGKLAKQFRDKGLSVMLAAGDTFRAAAIEQLQIWGERTGCPVIARDVGADAAGLAFDALKAAEEQGADLLFFDTAGRLQNKGHLMAELEKVIRVLKKRNESAPHSCLLVLDATTGQNAIGQTEEFSRICNVTGLVMTKLDGSARGGVLIGIADRFGLPVHAVGVGEGVDDLQPFEAEAFARALTDAR